MTKNFIIALLAVIIVLILLTRTCNPVKPEVVTTVQTDTLIKRITDTIWIKEPAPMRVVYRDKIIIDTDTIGIALLPEELIDSLVGEYYAVRYYDTTLQTSFGSLRKMDTVVENRLYGTGIYPQFEIPTITRTITNTIYQKPGKVSLGLQAGYGFDGNRFHPYIGAGVQWNIIQFKKRKP